MTQLLQNMGDTGVCEARGVGLIASRASQPPSRVNVVISSPSESSEEGSVVGMILVE